MEAAKAALVMMVLEEGWLLLGQLRSRQLSERGVRAGDDLSRRPVLKKKGRKDGHARKMQLGAPRPPDAEGARFEKATPGSCTNLSNVFSS